MRAFVFDPKEEQIKEFNDRIGAFCEEVPCVAVTSKIVNNLLVLVLLGAEDMPMPQAFPVVVPTVRSLSAYLEDLEGKLNGLIAQVAGASSDPDVDAPLPLDLQLVERADKPGHGWVVLVSCMGITESDEEGPADEGPFTCPHCGKDIEEEEDEEQEVEGLAGEGEINGGDR
jgi:hypothetical protein